MYTKVGIIGAMVEEIELLLNHSDVSSTFQKAGITFYEGRLNGKDVIFAKSGVGKVNAAVCTQILIDQGVDCVLFTGVAGALDPQLEIGDIVISSSCVQHDMDVSPLGFDRGVIPFQDVSDFAAEPALIELAEQASKRLFKDRYRIGKILSGDQFVANRGLVQELHETMGGICTEMEGAALAQVCAMNNIPYVVIRSMSDKADGSAHVNFAEFTVKAADHSYRIINDIVSHM